MNRDSRRVGTFAGSIRDDIRYGIRMFVRTPGVSLIALTAIALGIGATTAMFSIVDRVLFRPLPYANEARLVSVGMMAPLDSNEFMFAGEYFNLHRDHGPFDAVSTFQAGAFDCDLTSQNPQRVRCLRMESNFLDLLGVKPAAGRWLNAGEDKPGGPSVVLISYGLWQSRFHADPAVGSKWIEIDGASQAIAGVLPKDFEMPTLTHADVIMPLALRSTETAGRALRTFALLKSGTNVMQAREQLRAHFDEALKMVPPQFRKEVSLSVRSVRDRQVGDVRLASLALFGSVLAVLLIACANVATLLVARAASRDREMAMRAALGASRPRIFRQVLTESLLLAITGGILGVAMGYALLRIMVSLAPAGLPHMDQAAVDLRVLVFAVAASVGSGVLFGVAPALRKSTLALIGGWRSTAGGTWLRSVLVTVQIAVSIVLLAGAGLLLRSLWNLQQAPLGMRTEHVLAMKFVLGKASYGEDVRQIAFFSELEERLRAIPGVEAAAITDSLPPSGGTRSRPLATIDVEGRPRRPEGTGGMVAWRFVSPGYFGVLGVPIVRGRGFSETDRDPEVHPIVVSESLARGLFPNENPLGQHLLKTSRGDWFTVVGVAGEVRNAGLSQVAQPEYYLVRKTVPDATYGNQEPPTGWRAATAVVRTSMDPKLIAGSVRRTFAALDPALPVELETLRERLSDNLQRPRFTAALLMSFAFAGLLLAVAGLYGVVAFLANQRRQEIGVRMALGATPGQISAMVIGYAVRLTAVGAVAGLAGAMLLSRVVRSMLFGVGERDPLTLVAVLGILALSCVAAAWLPSRRAARMNPIDALHHD